MCFSLTAVTGSGDRGKGGRGETRHEEEEMRKRER